MEEIYVRKNLKRRVALSITKIMMVATLMTCIKTQDQTNMERFIRLSHTFRTLSREERVKELQISGRIIKQEIQRWLNQAEYFGNQLEDPQQLQTLYDQVSDTLLQQGRIPPPQSQQQRTDRQEQQKAPE